MPMTAEEVIWAYRILLDRDPESAEVVEAQRNVYPSLAAIKAEFIKTHEFRSYYNSLTPASARYAIPPFLLPETQNAKTLNITLPSLAEPTSQLCTAQQFDEADYDRIRTILGSSPQTLQILNEGAKTLRHRKFWEWVYIYRVLEVTGALKNGARGIGFGCGKEPLVSAFAKLGVEIVATDAPSTVDGNQGWATTEQHSAKSLDLWNPAIIDKATFEARVSFEEADMRDISSHLKGFNFTWSSCSLEHLGSLRAGLDFINRSMDCLVPGGIAVHTTEFNLTSNHETLEIDWLSIYRRRDIEEVTAELEAAGHKVFPINFFPGQTELDEYIDLPPFNRNGTHIKLEYLGQTFTSIGLVVQKRT